MIPLNNKIDLSCIPYIEILFSLGLNKRAVNCFWFDSIRTGVSAEI